MDSPCRSVAECSCKSAGVILLPLSLSLSQVLLLLAVLCGLECGAVELPASQWSRKENHNITLRQHRICVENEQYLHQGLCCLNCQAGKDLQAKQHGTVLKPDSA